MKKKVVHYYENLLGDLHLVVIREFEEPFDIDSNINARISKLRLAEFILREQLKLTPWFLPFRKSFLNLCILHAIEERVKFAEYQKQKL